MADWSDEETTPAKPAAKPKASNDDWEDKKSNARPERPPRRDGGEGDFKETITVEGRKCGKIVGAGGAVIKELQSEYSVKINIDREEDDDGNKKVEVCGAEDDVKNALKAINGKIGGDRAPRQETNMYDDNGGGDYSETITVEARKCGKIVGPKGAVIQELQSEYGVKINIDREADEDDMKKVEVIGSEDNVKQAVKAIEQKVGGGGGARQESNMYDDNGDKETVVIWIPTTSIGKLVGKGGENIKKFSEDHNVRLNIDRDGEEDDGKKKVEIIGSLEDCNKAKKNIEKNYMSSGDGDDKPREAYIPPEPSNDEAVMFGAGIAVGINFEKLFQTEVSVTGQGSENIKPLKTFEAAQLRSLILDNVLKSGYTKPTPIQSYGIPYILQGRDLMACAQTGSGKTAAFVLPIINKILADSDNMNIGQPQALIIAPTRELVIQIFDETRKFSSKSVIRTCLAYGGTTSGHQLATIERGCHILVATPGRLMDYVGKGQVSFSSLKFLVLDEADRMLDMGFSKTIEEISQHSTFDKKKIQTLMFSATFPDEIQRLAGTFLNDYIFLTVGIVGGASEDVAQEFFEVSKFKKRAKLEEVLKEYCDNSEEDRILVFVETKKTADFLASFLSETKISSTSIHGDRLQREREEALRDFRSGKRKVLIATSVAARGLDIKGVTHVINYDLPKEIQDYVHRIGRTGRVGNRGKASSFYDPEFDQSLAGDLARILKNANQPIPEFLGEAGAGYGADAFGGHDIRRGQGEAMQQEVEEEW